MAKLTLTGVDYSIKNENNLKGRRGSFRFSAGEGFEFYIQHSEIKELYKMLKEFYKENK